MRAGVLHFLVVSLLALAARAASGEPAERLQTLIDEAEPGAMITVPAGSYSGRIRIDKPMTLDGGGRVTIDGGGEGSVVEIVSPEVTLRGFLIRGSGQSVGGEAAGIRVGAGPVIIVGNILEDVYFGIDLKQSPGSLIRDNQISGKGLEVGRRGDGIRLWWSHGCEISGNEVRGLRDMVFWYSEDLRIFENSVSDSRYGLHFMYSHQTIVERNTLAGNSVGIYLMYSNTIELTGNTITNNRGTSGYGVGLKDCDDIIVQDNHLLANRVGIYVDNSPSSVDSTGLIEHNRIAFNEVGLLATPNTHDNVLIRNAFVENEEQVTVHGGGELTLNAFSRDGIGNFWSNYTGFDRDGDGIGDFPHAPRSLFRTLLAREPNLRVFVHSPAQQAVELTARAFPELSPSPMFEDPAPLTDVPTFEVVGTQARRRTVPAMAGLSAGLVGASSGLLVLLGRGGQIRRGGDRRAEERSEAS